jgi:hypothetical protein
MTSSEGDPSWKGSSIFPQCLWVLAENERSARAIVAKATALPALHLSLGEKIKSPWNDPALVSCEYDECKSVASGIICVSYGTRMHGAPPSQRMEAKLRF